MEQLLLDNPEHDRTPEYAIPEVLVLDFDRMLGNVDACMQRLYVAAKIEGIDVEEIQRARESVEKGKNGDDGGSFSPLSFIKKRLHDSGDPEAYDRFRSNFIIQGDPQILYKDADRFLAMLQRADMPHVIMTYGVDPEWQQLKLAAIRYPMGCAITNTPNKVKALQQLYTPGVEGQPGHFAMYVAAHGRARYKADLLTFIDDKSVAFDGLPQDGAYRGFWLQRPDNPKSQAGEVPPNVIPIDSLDKLTITEAGELVVGPRPDWNALPLRAKRRTPKGTLSIFDPIYALHGVYLPEHEDGVLVHDQYDDCWTAPRMLFACEVKAAA